jgi:uncharacterized protein
LLLVNARAGLSKVHGIGLIAHEFIPKGARVWMFHHGFDLVFTEAQVNALPAAAQQQVRWYAYYDNERHEYVLSGDDDRFTNHADDPNTASDGYATYALRDIHCGEEITWNYRDYGGAEFDEHTDRWREPPAATKPER